MNIYKRIRLIRETKESPLCDQESLTLCNDYACDNDNGEEGFATKDDVAGLECKDVNHVTTRVARKSRHIILHYSPFKAVWDWIIMFLVLYTAVLTPYSVAFVLNENTNRQNLNRFYKTRLRNANSVPTDTLVLIDLLVDIMFIVDILISFRTTFVKEGEVICDPVKIAFNYVKGWFVIDAIAAIPFDLILFGSGTAETMTEAEVLKMGRLLRLLRVVRKRDQFFQYAAAMLLLLMTTFTLVAHWLACIFYALSNMERPHLQYKISWLDQLGDAMGSPYHVNDTMSGPNLWSKYITALYFTFTTLTSIGFGNVAPNTVTEKVFAIFAMMLGSLLSAAIFGNVSSIIIRWNQGSAEYQEQLTSVKDFTDFHHIPRDLSQRLVDSFVNVWQYTNGIDMNKVLKSFPEHLQADICLHLNKNLLMSCPIFQRASPGCLRSLCLKFKTTHAPPGDTLIHPGNIVTSIYFIARGSLEITHNGNVMAILGKNDIFGLNIKTDTDFVKSSYSVKALSFCDINKIDYNDLKEILEGHPSFKDDLMENFSLTYDLNNGTYNHRLSKKQSVDPETAKFIRMKRPLLQAKGRHRNRSIRPSITPSSSTSRKKRGRTIELSTEKLPNFQRNFRSSLGTLRHQRQSASYKSEKHKSSSSINISQRHYAEPETEPTEIDDPLLITKFMFDAKFESIEQRFHKFERDLGITVDRILFLLGHTPKLPYQPQVRI